MAEYIEREAISEEIRKYYYKNPPNFSYGEGFDRGLDRAQRVILDAPAADVAPVVRCRKCDHLLFVEEDSDFPHKLAKVAGMSCPNCGERDEGLWRLLGRADEFEETIFVEEQDDE